MDKRGVFSKILAVAGCLLVWFPILAPVVLGFISWGSDKKFRFDFLMPAELFPAALVGGGLLLWSAIRARVRQRLIGWSLGITISMLAGGMVLSVVTGLASGETEPVGVWWALVIATIIAYSLALVVMGIGGGMLLRDLQK